VAASPPHLGARASSSCLQRTWPLQNEKVYYVKGERGEDPGHTGGEFDVQSVTTTPLKTREENYLSGGERKSRLATKQINAKPKRDLSSRTHIRKDTKILLQNQQMTQERQ